MKENNDTAQRICYWRRWEEQFKEPKTGTLKYALSNRKENGLDKCVRIINKRMYLDIKETFEYFNNCRE